MKCSRKAYGSLFLLMTIYFSFIEFKSACAQDSTNTTSSGLDTLKSPAFKKIIHSIQRGENDSVRIASNNALNHFLDSLLLVPSTLSATFDSLQNISVLDDPDQNFRIYTWTLPHFDGNRYEYFGYIQIRGTKPDQIQLYKLKDSSAYVLKPESEKLNSEKWYGAVYYSILKNISGKRTFYTLLGWKGQNNVTTQKVIEILYFDRSAPKFGFPLFKMDKVYKNRLVFTFSSQATMALRYDPSKNMIVYDHLSGSSSGDQGDNSIIPGGPDGTYNGLRFKSGKWNLMKDIDVRTNWKSRKPETR